MADDVKLNLKVQDSELLSALDALNGDLAELAPAADKAEKSATEFGAALARLDALLETVDDDALVFKQHLEQTPAALDKAAAGAEKLEKSTRNMGRATLEAGRILQDFAQGGLGGILNNIEGAAAALGGGPGLAGTLTAVGLAAYFAGPALRTMWNELFAGANDVPKAADRLDAWTEALKSNRDRLKELSDQHTLTNAELAEYNRLTADAADLEKKANAERARRNALEAARKEEAAGSPESAEIAKAAVAGAGGVDSVVNDAETALQNRSATLQDAVKAVDDARRKGAEAAQNPLNVLGVIAAARRIGEARKALEAAVAATRAEAVDLVTEARKGDVDSIRKLSGLGVGGEIGQALPESIKAQDAEVQASADEGERIARANAKRKAAAARADGLTKQGRENEADLARKAADDDARLTDDLNDQARGNEAAWRADVDRGAKADDRRKAAERRKAEAAARPSAQIEAFHDRALEAAAGVAIGENDGEFNPAQLGAIAREAADNAGGLDGDSIRRAVYQAAAMTRARLQADLQRQMMRVQVDSDSFLGPY